MYSSFFIIVIASITHSNGLPTGAPPVVCLSPTLTPGHGGIKPQPPSTMPYTVTASSDKYQSGDEIELTISGGSVRTFKGFAFQARDSYTNEIIGEFLPTTNSHPVKECGLGTHNDRTDKHQVILIWKAPTINRSGKLYFTGTIVEQYDTFWIEIIAKTDDGSQ